MRKERPAVKIKDGKIVIRGGVLGDIENYTDKPIRYDLVYWLDNRIVRLNWDRDYVFNSTDKALEFISKVYLPAIKKAVDEAEYRLKRFQKDKSDLEKFLEPYKSKK